MSLELGFGGRVECGPMELGEKDIPNRGSYQDKGLGLSFLGSLCPSDRDMYQR